VFHQLVQQKSHIHAIGYEVACEYELLPVNSWGRGFVDDGVLLGRE
jgi:hypothetical protein